MDQKICLFCNSSLLDNFSFCPNCGKKINGSLSTAIGKQIGIYALSIFLPPLGFWPGFKYLFQDNQKAKIIGIVAIILTIASTIMTVWLTMNFFNQIYKSINVQSNEIRSLGF